MSQTGDRNIGGMVDPAMGAGGPAVPSEEDILIEVEGQAPGLVDETLQDMIVQMNEDGSAELVDPNQQGEEVLTEEYSHTANLAEILSDAALGEISSDILSKIEEDIDSRGEWEDALAKGLNLLGINYEERDEPFAGASGVTHPLISESVTQFQAQAYKEMLPAGGPIRTAVVGMESPETLAQATRVKNFMNYYVTEIMEEYDPDMDQMLFYLPLSGSTFKKVYFDPSRQRAISKFIPAEDLVVNYSASDLQTAERVTHVTEMSENDIIKMQMATFYRDVDLSRNYDGEDGEVKDKINEIQGIRPTGEDDMYTIYECHTYLDLEGFEDTDIQGEQTGLKLPYIVSIDKNSGEVLSIVRNWDEEDPLRKPTQYFIHYKFLPGLGFYGFGLVHMIGGLSRAATSILRQLIDAGTLSNLPAGFKSRGTRIKNDDEPIQPGEFRDIDAPGGDVRSSFLPLPYKEPSGTLAQLLGVLVESGRRYASIADANIQDVNQQMPVGTTVALLERGSRVMSAIHKRMHYAQKKEFRLLAEIISETIDAYPYPQSVPAEILPQDFDSRIDVLPISDPNIFSMAQRMSLAQTQLQLAQSNPEVHNLREAYRRMYEALEVKNIDAILKPEPQAQPMDPAAEHAALLKGEPIQAYPGQNHDAHIAAHTQFMAMPLIKNNPMVFSLTLGNIQERISLKATEEVQMMLQQQMQEFVQQQVAAGMPPEMIQPPQMGEEQIQAMISAKVAEITVDLAPALMPEDPQDPLVGIRQAEVQIAAADQQRKSQKDQVDAMLDQAKMAQQAQQAQERLQTQRDIAEDRAAVNRERIETQEDIAVMREMGKR